MTSMWDIPDVENMQTPLSILKVQATELTRITRGLLQGEAKILDKSAQANMQVIALYIHVPALSNYIFHVLSYRQPIVLYPGVLMVPFLNENDAIEDENYFNEALKRVLSSPELKRILAGLLAQAR